MLVKSLTTMSLLLISITSFGAGDVCKDNLSRGDKYTLQADALKASGKHDQANKAYKQAASYYRQAKTHCKNSSLVKAKTSYNAAKKCASRKKLK